VPFAGSSLGGRITVRRNSARSAGVPWYIHTGIYSDRSDVSRQNRSPTVPDAYFGSKFGELFDPVVEYAQRADDQKRAEILSLTEIGIKCDRLESLREVNYKVEERSLCGAPFLDPSHPLEKVRGE
jgi:hypothetical protein